MLKGECKMIINGIIALLVMSNLSQWAVILFIAKWQEEADTELDMLNACMTSHDKSINRMQMRYKQIANTMYGKMCTMDNKTAIQDEHES